MNFVIGKDYKTAGGWKAICVYKGELSILFVHMILETEQSQWHARDGTVWNGIENYNIISEWEEPAPPVVLEGWVNVYDDGQIGNCYNTKSQADNRACRNRLECTHIRYDSSAPPEKRIVTVVDKEAGQ